MLKKPANHNFGCDNAMTAISKRLNHLADIFKKE